MQTPHLIKLQYVWHISQPTAGQLEQMIWHDAWTEFALQCQRYNEGGKWHTLEEMTAADGRANSLHYKVGFAIGGYLQNLQHRLPGFSDKTGTMGLPFERWELRLLVADLHKPDTFKLAILLDSPAYELHSIMGTQLLLSSADEPMAASGWQRTFMVDVQGPLSIAAQKPQALQQAITVNMTT